jgi:DNA polymerase-3 subunit alpha
MTEFVHLRAHSHFSINDGLLDPEDLVKLAVQDGQSAIALTDAHKMFGTIQFYKAAQAAGVKPIVGADVWIDPDITRPSSPGADDPAPVRMLLLAQDEIGYKRLMGLVSRSYVENLRHGVPRIRQSWLAEDCQHLIGLSGGELDGEIATDLLSEKPETARKTLAAYKTWFGDRFYLEVQRAGFPNEDKLVPALVELSQSSGVPLVATHPIQFAERSDYFTHEVKVCIGSSAAVADVRRQTPFTREQSFQTKEQMQELFSDIPQALENAGILAQRLSVDIELGKPYLPRYETGNGQSEDEMFAELSRVGLEDRLKLIFPDPAVRAASRAKYDERLESEIGIISKMGFSGYYLIVSDFIRWAKSQDIPVGPGRGSGAGSLAAFALLITDLDPLPYDLLFERFLNPERVSMPDFDIDFCMDRRNEVVDYVRQKYGAESVARISTFTMLKAKAAIKGAARALSLPYMLSDSISKLIPKALDITLERALEEQPKLLERIGESADVAKLFRVAQAIEDKPSAVGVHAGGVLIAPGRTSNFTPLYLSDPADGAASQYDKDDVEYAGLVKFDFLGLSTLTAIHQTVKMINARPDRKDNPLDINLLPLDDAETYRFLGEAKTVGVFQFESGGMRGYMKKLQPSGFEDLISLAALYRPGPMDLIPEFIERRHGRVDVIYPHPCLEPVLKPTYGIIVYQEQVMQIAQVMAGYSLGGADLLRRAMGKKKPEEMAKERSKFESGAAANGVDPKTATAVFDLMEKFAAYGFNKSHAAAYAVVAYQTAWLKHHYPAEFYAGVLNINAGKTDKLMKFIGDARTNEVKILPPDINEAGAHFTTTPDGAIRYGLTGLKGVGESAVRGIVEARESQGAFTSFYDFCRKVGRGTVNKTSVESLIRAGAFDQLHPNRAAVLEAVKDGLKYSSDLAKVKPMEEASLIPELFGDAPAKKKKAKVVKVIVEPSMPSTPPWSSMETLNNELVAIGFYLSGHPFDGYAEKLGGLKAATPLNDIDSVQPGEYRFVAGLVASVRTITNKNREVQAYVVVDDGRDQKDVTIFASTWAESGNWIKPGVFISMEAKVEADTFKDDDSNKLVADSICDFEATEKMLLESINVAIRKPELAKLSPVLAAYADDNGLPVAVFMPEDNDRYYRADINAKIARTPAALSALRQAVGDQFVQPGFAATAVFPPRQDRRGPKRGGPRQR